MALSEEARARRVRPPTIPDMHAFLAKHGHATPHQDKHIAKVISGAKTFAAATRALTKHPAFFRQSGPPVPGRGWAVAPGEHRFTGKPAAPRVEVVRAPPAEVAKRVAPQHVGAHAAAQHLRASEAFEARSNRALRTLNPLPEHPRFTPSKVKHEAHLAHQDRERDISRVSTMYATSAQAHRESARAARMHSASQHENAARLHMQAAKMHGVYGELKQHDAHAAHAEAHTKAANAVRALTKPASAAAQKVAWLKKAPSLLLSKASAGGAGGATKGGWRAAAGAGGRDARKSGWAAWKAKKASAGQKV